MYGTFLYLVGSVCLSLVSSGVLYDMGISKNQAPQYAPQMVGLLLEGHKRDPPIYRNSHVFIGYARGCLNYRFV